MRFGSILHGTGTTTGALYRDRPRRSTPMTLVEVVREKQEALRAQDLAQLLGVSAQQIYKMAAKGEIPSFKVANAVRFDPHETAEWLRERYPVRSVELRFPAAKRA
jgi:excisionase family DNA binding protein